MICIKYFFENDKPDFPPLRFLPLSFPSSSKLSQIQLLKRKPTLTQVLTPLPNVQAVCITPFGHQRELKAATQSKSSRFCTQVLMGVAWESSWEYGEAELEAGNGGGASAHTPVAPTCSWPRAAEGSYLTFVEHLSLREAGPPEPELTNPCISTSTTTRHL